MKKILYLIETLLFAVISYCLIMINEQDTQVPRYVYFTIAILVLQVIMLGLSNLPYKSLAMWGWLAVCMLGAVLIIHFRHYNAEYYGEVYHHVVRRGVFITALFVFYIPILIKNKFSGYREKEKSPLFWLSIAVLAIFCIYEEAVLAFALMFLLWMGVAAGKEKITELSYCACSGYLIIFVYLFTYSLIAEPIRSLDGRYVGIFWYTAKIGEMCAFAFLCTLFFLIRWIESKRNKALLLFIIPSMVYTAFAVAIVGGRSSIIGLAITFFALVAVWKAKTKTAVLKRVACMIGVSFLFISIVLVYCWHITKKIDNGELKQEETSYGVSHVVGFLKNDYPKGDFKEGTLINALDILSSGRISLWNTALHEVIPWGSSEAKFFKTHNTYLFWYVYYGYICGTICLVWFIIYLIISVRRFAKGNMTALIPFLCSTFMAGLMTGTNEYLCGLGIFILMLVQYPLMIKSEDEN